MKELFSLGHSYSKIDMSNIIDQNDSLHLSREDKNKMVSRFRTCREGILTIHQFNTTVLFVTLDKTGREERFQFNDYFGKYYNVMF